MSLVLKQEKSFKEDSQNYSQVRDKTVKIYLGTYFPQLKNSIKFLYIKIKSPFLCTKLRAYI